MSLSSDVYSIYNNNNIVTKYSYFIYEKELWNNFSYDILCFNALVMFLDSSKQQQKNEWNMYVKSRLIILWVCLYGLKLPMKVLVCVTLCYLLLYIGVYTVQGVP